jgi:hypothetical protein
MNSNGSSPQLSQILNDFTHVAETTTGSKDLAQGANDREHGCTHKNELSLNKTRSSSENHAQRTEDEVLLHVWGIRT